MTLYKDLHFREMTKEDYHLIEAIYTNPLVMTHTLDDCCDEDDLRGYHKKILGEQEMGDKRHFYNFVVSYSGDFIGFADMTIHILNKAGGIAEIGYLLLPEYWGKGFATSMGGFLIGFCFKNLNLHKVTASCNVNNIGSQKVLEKNNMKLEGRLKKQRFKNNSWDDELHYAILKEEYTL